MTRVALAWPSASMCAWMDDHAFDAAAARLVAVQRRRRVLGDRRGRRRLRLRADDANVAHRLAAIAGELTRGCVVDRREIRRADLDRRAPRAPSAASGPATTRAPARMAMARPRDRRARLTSPFSSAAMRRSSPEPRAMATVGVRLVSGRAARTIAIRCDAYSGPLAPSPMTMSSAARSLSRPSRVLAEPEQGIEPVDSAHAISANRCAIQSPREMCAISCAQTTRTRSSGQSCESRGRSTCARLNPHASGMLMCSLHVRRGVRSSSDSATWSAMAAWRRVSRDSPRRQPIRVASPAARAVDNSAKTCQCPQRRQQAEHRPLARLDAGGADDDVAGIHHGRCGSRTQPARRRLRAAPRRAPTPAAAT